MAHGASRYKKARSKMRWKVRFRSYLCVTLIFYCVLCVVEEETYASTSAKAQKDETALPLECEAQHRGSFDSLLYKKLVCFTTLCTVMYIVYFEHASILFDKRKANFLYKQNNDCCTQPASINSHILIPRIKYFFQSGSRFPGFMRWVNVRS